MKKHLVAVAMLILAMSACGVRPTGAIYGGPGPTETLEDTQILYFANDNTLTRVIRPITDITNDVLTLLVEGPLGPERAQGLTSDVPTTVLPITRGSVNGTMEVIVSSPTTTLTEMAQNQLICTAAHTTESPKPKVTLTGPDKSLPARTCPFTP